MTQSMVMQISHFLCTRAFEQQKKVCVHSLWQQPNTICVPQKILLELAGGLGLHDRILLPIRAMYATLRRRFIYAGSVGSEFKATNGILQGCPLSVVLLNALIAVWAKAVNEEIPGAVADAYVDDT